MGLGISGNVAVELMESYLNKGHSLFTDNFHSSYILSNYLFDLKTGVIDKVDFTTQEKQKKHMCVVKYNARMGSVDRVDMMLSSITCKRKTIIKWYKKAIFSSS